MVDAVFPDYRLVIARLATLAALPRAEAAAEEARLRREVDAGHRLAWQHEAAVGEADPEPILDSRQERLVLAPLRGRILHLGEDALAVERPAEEGGEVLERVEAPVRAQGVLPLLEPERLAASAVGREPRLEDGRLGVDDEPVEVEDDRADPVSQGTQPRAAASCATRARMRS